MARAELDHLEGDVQDARQRLRSDLAVLRAPATFSTFKQELVAEARQSGDDAIAHAKAAATTWSERLVAEIKERAAANPVAVGAITAGIGWRILRKPPITTMLVGYGLYALWHTKPGQLAPGAETVYRAADAAVAATEQVRDWGREAGEVIAQAHDIVVPAVAGTIESWTAEAGEIAADVTGAAQALVAQGSESVRRWGEDAGAAVAETADSLQAVAIRGSQRVHHMASDQQERDKVLIAAAAVALTTAIGLICLRRA